MCSLSNESLPWQNNQPIQTRNDNSREARVNQEDAHVLQMYSYSEGLAPINETITVYHRNTKIVNFHLRHLMIIIKFILHFMVRVL